MHSAQAAISVVLPCYRAAGTARRSVERLSRSLAKVTDNWEVVVVDDGGGDFSNVPFPDQRVRLIELPVNRGKGAAVRAGMLAATGRSRIFTDVDLPYGTEVINVIARYLMAPHCHMVIGDRMMPSSRYHANLSVRRRAISRVSSQLIGGFVTGGFFDTQCGIKGVTSTVADEIFPLVTLERFTFDVEVIYIALLHRLDIRRVPVQLESNETSTVRPVLDAARGVLDLLKIKRNQLKGRYRSLLLNELAEAEYRAMLRLG